MVAKTNKLIIARNEKKWDAFPTLAAFLFTRTLKSPGFAFVGYGNGGKDGRFGDKTFSKSLGG